MSDNESGKEAQKEFRSRQADRNNQRAVSVFTAHDPMEADLIKEFLHSCGIECVIQGRVIPSFFPNPMGSLGGREILVLEDDVEDATELLAGWRDKSAAEDDAE